MPTYNHAQADKVQQAVHDLPDFQQSEKMASGTADTPVDLIGHELAKKNQKMQAQKNRDSDPKMHLRDKNHGFLQPRTTRIELATFGSTVRCSNQLSYVPICRYLIFKVLILLNTFCNAFHLISLRMIIYLIIYCK